MSDESKIVDTYVRQAPSEPDISLPGFHVKRVRIALNDKLPLSHTLASLLEEEVLLGCGRVEIANIHVLYTATRSGLTIMAGLVNARSNATMAQIAMTRGNFAVTSNAMNAGVMHVHDLSIPGIFSRQIQPTSSLLPDFKLCVKHDPGIMAQLELELNVYGEEIVTYDIADLIGQPSD